MAIGKLTRKQKKFADAYIEGESGVQAALKSYDTKDYNSANVIAVENLQKLTVREYIESKAEVAAGVVFTLATSATNETVKLNASKDILDRSGLKPIERSINMTIGVSGELREKSKDAINQFLQEQ